MGCLVRRPTAMPATRREESRMRLGMGRTVAMRIDAVALA